MSRFDHPDFGVAGVGASPPLSDALFPVRRQAGGIRTAAALHNLEAEAMGVNCRLMSGGVALEEVEIHLEANGQTSWFIVARMEARLRDDIKQLGDRVGRMEHSQAKLEGLLEGLREAISGRVKAS